MYVPFTASASLGESGTGGTASASPRDCRNSRTGRATSPPALACASRLMLCGPRMRCTPGCAATKALTTSNCPSMAAEKSVGRAPFEIRYSAIGRLPMCDAPPSASSQSPNPQSQDARASEGRASTNPLTRLRSKCATVTISRASSGGCVGNRSGTTACGAGSCAFAVGWLKPKWPTGIAARPSFNKSRRD